MILMNSINFSAKPSRSVPASYFGPFKAKMNTSYIYIYIHIIYLVAVLHVCLLYLLDGFFRSVFWALFGAIYLCFGVPEVYRVLFEVFGMDPEDESCQPKLRRQLEDVDHVSVEFENRKLSWQDVAAYKVRSLLLVPFKLSSWAFNFRRILSSEIEILLRLYSLPKTLSSRTRGSSGRASPRGCTVSGGTYGTSSAGPGSCRRWAIRCR